MILYGSSITYARTVLYLNKKDIVQLRTPLPSVIIKIVCGTVSSSVSSNSNQCGYCTAYDEHSSLVNTIEFNKQTPSQFIFSPQHRLPIVEQNNASCIGLTVSHTTRVDTKQHVKFDTITYLYWGQRNMSRGRWEWNSDVRGCPHHFALPSTPTSRNHFKPAYVKRRCIPRVQL
jgi:hypothetical protein